MLNYDLRTHQEFCPYSIEHSICVKFIEISDARRMELNAIDPSLDCYFTFGVQRHQLTES